MVKNLPARQETRVRSLDWEVALEKGMATHSSVLAMESSMDREAWWLTVHGVAKNWTRLTHSSVLAWRIPGTGEPGGLPSMGSHRVGHD